MRNDKDIDTSNVGLIRIYTSGVGVYIVFKASTAICNETWLSRPRKINLKSQTQLPHQAWPRRACSASSPTPRPARDRVPQPRLATAPPRAMSGVQQLGEQQGAASEAPRLAPCPERRRRGAAPLACRATRGRRRAGRRSRGQQRTPAGRLSRPPALNIRVGVVGLGFNGVQV